MDFFRRIPPVTRHLIIINIAIWLVMAICDNGTGTTRNFTEWLVSHLGLSYWGGSHFNPIQTVTYMFVHDPTSPLHVLFNMFSLWMFGRLMEQVWGSRRFFIYYFVCGVGAALVQELVWQFSWMHEMTQTLARLNGMSPEAMGTIIREGIASGDSDVLSALTQFKNSMVTVGASGAVFGILLGFAFMFPNIPLYLFFIPVPIKAKYMVIGYGVLEFFLGVTGSQSSVAHFAHLGGMIFGLILLLYWRKKGTFSGTYFG